MRASPSWTWFRRLPPGATVLTIDTGRLPPATFEMIQAIEQRYDIAVERIVPDPAEVASMVESYGIDLFRDSYPQRMLCCQVRKVRPLAKRMKTVPAFFAGLRRGQSESREDIEVVDRSSTPVENLAAGFLERGRRSALHQRKRSSRAPALP